MSLKHVWKESCVVKTNLNCTEKNYKMVTKKIMMMKKNLRKIRIMVILRPGANSVEARKQISLDNNKDSVLFFLPGNQ